MITSPANKKVKEVRALFEKASLRAERGLFPVEGVRMFLEAPAAEIEELYVSESFAARAEGEVREKIEALGAETVADNIFAKMSDTKTPQGVLALLRMQRKSLAEVLAKGASCFLAVESLQDPGNLGTMLRAGEGAGLSAILANRGTVDIYNPKVIRATMGSIFRVPVVYADDWLAALRELSANHFSLYAAALQASVSYDSIDYPEKTAFLIGNEAAGLTAETIAMADQSIHIPMLGQVESLNAAVAASVLLYERARQRRRGTR